MKEDVIGLPAEVGFKQQVDCEKCGQVIKQPRWSAEVTIHDRDVEGRQEFLDDLVDAVRLHFDLTTKSIDFDLSDFYTSQGPTDSHAFRKFYVDSEDRAKAICMFARGFAWRAGFRKSFHCSVVDAHRKDNGDDPF
jgi:hypothetical protein